MRVLALGASVMIFGTNRKLQWVSLTQLPLSEIQDIFLENDKQQSREKNAILIPIRV